MWQRHRGPQRWLLGRASDPRVGLLGICGRALVVTSPLLRPALRGVQLPLAPAARCRARAAGPPQAAEPARPVRTATAAGGRLEQLVAQPVVEGAVWYVRCGRPPDVFGADVGVAEQGGLVRGLFQEFVEGEGRGQPFGDGRQAERRDEPAGVGRWSLIQEPAEPACWSAGHPFMVAWPGVGCHVLAPASRPAGGTGAAGSGPWREEQERPTPYVRSTAQPVHHGPTVLACAGSSLSGVGAFASPRWDLWSAQELGARNRNPAGGLRPRVRRTGCSSTAPCPRHRRILSCP